MGTWFNKDGLYLKFGTTKATPEIAGDYKTYGEMREISFVLDLTTLAATDGSTIVSDTTRFPELVQVTRIEITNQVTATGTNAVLNLGLVEADRTTEVDFNGLLAGLPLTSMDVVGETTSITQGGTYAGVLLGAVPTSSSKLGMYITADYDTAAFTAGKVLIRIFYRGYSTITQ